MLRVNALAPTAWPRCQRNLIVCPYCDAVFAQPRLAPSEVARCGRCDGVIARGHRIGIRGQLALVLTGLIVFALANLFPIVTLEIRGLHNGSTLLEAVRALRQSDAVVVAGIAAAAVFLFPLCELMLRLWVLLPIHLGRRPWLMAPAMRMLRFSEHWSMVEVYMIGVLVTIVKIGSMAKVIPGVGVFCFAILTVLIAALRASGLYMIWESAERRGLADWPCNPPSPCEHPSPYESPSSGAAIAGARP